MLKFFASAGIAAIAMSLSVALPATAELADTYSPDEETISDDGRDVSLPSVPATPALYALPMEVTIVTDSSITTDTPITDSLSEDVAAWGEAIRGCLVQTPILLRETAGGDVPFIVGTVDGTIQLNANGNAVCAL